MHFVFSGNGMGMESRMSEIVYEKPPIFQLRELNAGWMNHLTTGVKSFIDSHNFYPSVFYNENDINHPINGIRYAVPDLDNYSGVFVHQIGVCRTPG